MFVPFNQQMSSKVKRRHVLSSSCFHDTLTPAAVRTASVPPPPHFTSFVSCTNTFHFVYLHVVIILRSRVPLRWHPAPRPTQTSFATIREASQIRNPTHQQRLKQLYCFTSHRSLLRPAVPHALTLTRLQCCKSCT